MSEPRWTPAQRAAIDDRGGALLVVGGSGSGKTRFWLKPNLLQCHSSYVVTDPKGSIVVVSWSSVGTHF